MSTKKTPEEIAEEIAEERYSDLQSTDMQFEREYKRQGYAACYREHVLNRHPGSDDDTVVVKYQTDSDGIIDGSGETWTACGYDNPDRVQERFRGDFSRVWIAAWHESRMHLIGKSLVVPKTRISTPPVTVEGIMEVDVEKACEVMHDAYEVAAKCNGWETQVSSRKPWADVPESNKATMREAVKALLSYLANSSREWVYEDQLPDMTSEEYDKWYNQSKVIDGVRMGPAVTPNTKP